MSRAVRRIWLLIFVPKWKLGPSENCVRTMGTEVSWKSWSAEASIEFLLKLSGETPLDDNGMRIRPAEVASENPSHLWYLHHALRFLSHAFFYSQGALRSPATLPKSPPFPNSWGEPGCEKAPLPPRPWAVPCCFQTRAAPRYLPDAIVFHFHHVEGVVGPTTLLVKLNISS